jgi:dTMP kinase
VGGLDAQAIESAIALASAGLEPDLTLYLDCPVALGRERLKNRAGQSIANDGAGRYDAAHLELHRALHAGFRALAQKWPERIKVLDARKSPDELLADALRCIRENC